MSEYTKASIALLKAKARRLIKDDRARVVHIHPRAYCVAKTALYCAVFAVPTCDREPQVADNDWDVVNNKSCAGVKMGDWCSVAYISTRTGGECHVLEILKPRPVPHD